MDKVNLNDENKKKLLELIELAVSHLNQEGIPYHRTKKMLRSLFDSNVDVLAKIRLLDKEYSTQLKKTPGIDLIIAGKLNNPEYHFNKKINKFMSQFESDIQERTEFFKNVFEDEDFAKEFTSFWSKYIFFHTKFNFPIYDSKVLDSLKILNELKIIQYKIKTKADCFDVLIELKKELCTEYGNLDNFLWLLGKINSKSFSGIVFDNEYTDYKEKATTPQSLSDFINKCNECKIIKK